MSTTEEYFADPRINASTLKLFAGKKFNAATAVHAMKTPRASTKAMDIGTIVHAFIEHEGKEPPGFVLSPYDSFRTKESKEWRDEQIANGVIVLKDEEFEQARNMAHNLLEKIEEPYRTLLTSSTTEREKAFYNDTHKALLDLISPSGLIGADVKTTRHSNWEDVKRDFDAMFYHLQFYHYKKMSNCEEFCAFIVSSVEPYPVFQAPCSDDYLAFGAWEFDRAQDRFNRFAKYEVDDLLVSEHVLEAPQWFLKMESDS